MVLGQVGEVVSEGVVAGGGDDSGLAPSVGYAERKMSLIGKNERESEKPNGSAAC